MNLRFHGKEYGSKKGKQRIENNIVSKEGVSGLISFTEVKPNNGTLRNYFIQLAPNLRCSIMISVISKATSRIVSKTL